MSTPPFDATRLRAVLCDADGNLFPSEEPAFRISVTVVNRFLAEIGSAQRYSPDELRRAATGMNFRSTAVALARAGGLHVEADVVLPAGAPVQVALGSAPAQVLSAADLEAWVRYECEQVTAELLTALRPDRGVLDAVRRLAESYELAVVSSSSDARLAASLAVTGLGRFFPRPRRFSAEDSLPRPSSKPDPAIYQHTLLELELDPEEAVAVEDSVPGVSSAVAAGIATIGNVQFVDVEERADRRESLMNAGAVAVVDDWTGVLGLVGLT